MRAIVTSADGALASAASAALSLTVDRTAPMATIGAIRLSADTGANTTDMVTGSAAQTIHATLSAPLDSGDIVLGSVDGGQSWADITAMVDGTALAWTGATLAAGGAIRLRVADEHGNQGAAAVAPYTLDTTAPPHTVTGLALEADNGTSVTDFVTNVRTQTISGTLSGATGTGEVVEVSLDGGTSWSGATNVIGSAAWSLAGQALAASGTLQVRVSDLAGNHGPVRAQAYTVDSEAPVAARPVRPDLVNPNGSFTFAVTYDDNGGAGLDAATFGTGNVTVRGAQGVLNVSGYAVAGGTVTCTVDAPAGGWVGGALGDYTIGIVGGAVRDLAGNAVGASANALAFHAGVRPSATVAVADSTLTAGETTTVTIAFAQPVLGLDLADLRVAHGTLSALGTADGGRTWTATLTPAAGAWTASNTVTLDMGGVMSVDGTAGSGQAQSNAYAVQTGTPPAPPAPATNATMDGVPVLSLTSVDPATGFEVRTIAVPSVPAGRAPGDLADIVLGAGSGTLKANITVGLPVGAGLEVSGPTTLLTHEQALRDLAHRMVTPALANAGQAFVAGLGANVPVQTATLAPVAGGAAVPLTIGAGGAAADVLLGGGGNDILYGGRDDGGTWSFALDSQGLLTARHATATLVAGQQEAVALAELDRAGAGLGFLAASGTALTELALLYQAASGRAPDLAGLNAHLQGGADVAAIARAFTASAEWRDTGLDRLDNGAFVRQMYEQVLGRKPDAEGLAYWTAQLEGAAGRFATRAEVLAGFALSDEARALHKAGIVIGVTGGTQQGDWFAGSGNDRLAGGAGNDVLAGGDGTDTAVYDVKRADARVTLGADGAVHVVTASGTDTIRGMELGEFTGRHRRPAFHARTGGQAHGGRHAVPGGARPRRGPGRFCLLGRTGRDDGTDGRRFRRLGRIPGTLRRAGRCRVRPGAVRQLRPGQGGRWRQCGMGRLPADAQPGRADRHVGRAAGRAGCIFRHGRSVAGMSATSSIGNSY
ncbi:Ig-like domain-containing protein [Pseudoduganella chitinolytica]|uniref:Ig-like domain-containing protein n=1 Tax=Pseudoduganella chitinolytica TaxID=34070 RepID=A0ABY8BCC8_9BURK|nr:Ig-like domain-containing protein [Pseudoduganella chitinolytica]WEF33460.1 Ig-like domain-containing protein [Pseudoduganella chitinolytica]